MGESTNDKSKKVRMTIRLDSAKHKKIKIKAINQGVTLENLIIELIRKDLGE